MPTVGSSRPSVSSRSRATRLTRRCMLNACPVPERDRIDPPTKRPRTRSRASSHPEGDDTAGAAADMSARPARIARLTPSADSTASRAMIMRVSPEPS
jgi:hypothetical protein